MDTLMDSTVPGGLCPFAGLADLVAPLSETDFFETYWERTFLAQTGGSDPERFKRLVTLEDIDRVITTQMPHHPEINLVSGGEGIDKGYYTFESGLIDPVRVFQHFDEGATIILQQQHLRIPALAELCRRMERDFSARFQTNLYLTPANAQGFRAHFDSHDVFVLQVAGSKDWKIYGTPLELPLRGQPFHPVEHPPGEISQTFTLSAGDLAYLPRGLAHDAVATTELSLHITLGVMVRTWADLLLEAVSDVCTRMPALRHSLPPGFAQPDFDRQGARDQFAALVRDLRERLRFDQALDHFAEEFEISRNPLVPGQMQQMASLSQVGPDSVVGARPGLIYSLRLEKDRCVLGCHGAEVQLPAAARDAVAFALETSRFAVRDLPGGLDADGQGVLVRRLIREGLLQRL